MTRSQVNATTQQNNAGALSPIIAGKNFLINGGFDFWQRGVSFAAAGAATTSTYTADRWNSGAPSNITISRVSGTTDGTLYALRIQKNATTTTGGDAFVCQTIESNNAILLSGKTVTLSFNVRKGTDFSGNGVYSILRFGTGTDEGSNSGYNGAWATYTQSMATVSPTSNMVNYQKTFSVPSGTKEIMVLMGVQSFPNGTAAGTNDWVEFEKIQLEVGPVATPFSRAGGTIAGELAACQRYYWRTSSNQLFGIYGIGFGRASGTSADILINAPVTMRAVPQGNPIDYGNLALSTPGSTATSITGITLTDEATYNVGAVNVTASVTSGKVYFLGNNNNASGYIAFSAEL